MLATMLPFTGNPLDRRSDKRSDAAWMAEHLARAKILPVWQTQVLVTGSPILKAAAVPLAAVTALAAPDAPCVFLVSSALFALNCLD